MRHKGEGGPIGVAKGSGFTWLGLAIALLGWALLIAGLLASDATLRIGTLVETLAARSDIVTIAQTAIGTGLGLAVIGTLRSGFGAFGRFFDAVLHRSTSRPQSVPEPARPMAEPREPEVVVHPVERGQAPPMPPPPLRSRERNYVVLPDGSVEVETLFGTRVFATLEEAREFIR
jgi:hypothetical protein